MTAIGVYSINTKQDCASKIHDDVMRIVMGHNEIIQMHGFFIDEIEKLMRFDIVVSFDSLDMRAIYNHVVDDVKESYPDYDVQVQFDFDVSD